MRCSAQQQQREITKFEVLMTTRAHKCVSIILYFYSETALTNTNFVLGYFAQHCTTRTRWPNREKLTIVQRYTTKITELSYYVSRMAYITSNVRHPAHILT